MFSESISQASPYFSDVNLVAGATFDEVYHVVAYTGVLGIDGDISPGSADRGWGVGVGAGVAPGPTAWKRTTIFDRGSCVVQMTSQQGVTRVVIVTICTHKTSTVLVGKCLSCLSHLAESGSFCS